MMESFLFLSVVFLVFTLPGLFVLHKLRLLLRAPEPFAVPTVTGVLLYILTAYILSWMHAVIILLPIILVIDFFAIKNKLWKFKFEKKHIIPLLCVLLAALFFSLPMTTVGFTQSHARFHSDDIIHLGYINELINHFPPDNPGISGIPLRGYHFFSDFLTSSLHQLSRLSITFLYFQGIPLFTAFLWGFGTYSLIFLWRKRIDTALWGVFLALFGGSFGFILRLQGHADVSLRSTFGIDQPYSALLNPPFAISVALLIGFLIFTVEYLSTKKSGWLLLMGLTAALLPMFKVYAGMLAIAGFGFCVLTDKKFSSLLIGGCAAILFFATYGVFAGQGAFLIWHPLWNTRNILRFSMPWYGYDEKIYTFEKFGMWWRIIKVELYGIFLYVFGNLGTSVIGYFSLFRRSRFHVMLLLMTGISLFIPLLFIQSIKVFEIVQLGWYYPFFLSLFAASGFSWLFDKTPTRIGKFLITLMLITTTLPSTYESFIHLVYPKPTMMGADLMNDPYFQTMAVLARDPNYDATVLEIPPIGPTAQHIDILSWYRTTLPYPAALGNKRSFFHTQNIDFPNVPLETRTALIKNILVLEGMMGNEATFAATLDTAINTLRQNNIVYILTQTPLTRLTTVENIYSTSPFLLYRFGDLVKGNPQ